jgi:hypothetical protein
MKSSQVVKFVVGHWTRPGITSVYTKEHNVIVTMEFKVSKRHILKPPLSIDMVQRVLWLDRQKRCYDRNRQELVVKKWRYNEILMNFFVGGIEDEDKRRQANRQTWIISRICPFLAFINIKNRHIHFSVHAHSSWFTFGLHIERGPNGNCKTSFLRNQSMEVGPSNQTMEKKTIFHGPTSWSTV